MVLRYTSYSGAAVAKIPNKNNLGGGFNLTLDFRGFCPLVWLGEVRTQHLSS